MTQVTRQDVYWAVAAKMPGYMQAQRPWAGTDGLRLGQDPEDKIRGLLDKGGLGSPGTLQTWANLYCRYLMVLFLDSRMSEERKVSGNRGLAPLRGHPHRDCRGKASERGPGVYPPSDPEGT